jgi:hypothetical protein
MQIFKDILIIIVTWLIITKLNMGCSAYKPKAQGITTLRQRCVETTSSDINQAKKLLFYDIIQAKEQVNKKKVLNAPLLDLNKSQLFQRRTKKESGSALNLYI